MRRTLALATAALLLCPALAAAQQAGDTTARRGRKTQASSGEIEIRGRAAPAEPTLTREQLRLLTRAITERTDCRTGVLDGTTSRAARRVLTCARISLGVTGTRMEPLFEALGLDFGDVLDRRNALDAVGSGRDDKRPGSVRSPR